MEKGSTEEGWQEHINKEEEERAAQQEVHAAILANALVTGNPKFVASIWCLMGILGNSAPHSKNMSPQSKVQMAIQHAELLMEAHANEQKSL